MTTQTPFLRQPPAEQALEAADRRSFIKTAGASAAALGLLSVAGTSAYASAAAPTLPALPVGADNFYRSDKVSLQKVAFQNQYGMQIVGNLYLPKSSNAAQLPALVVGHPMGAVKEQSANLYATKMAEQGFAALSIDLPFWGESEGKARNAVAPDLYAEAFSAAVDFLAAQDRVAAGRIGGIGICGSGGFIISAAKIDPRLRAIATVSMYDMGAVTRNGYGKSQTLVQRKAKLAQAAELRNQEYRSGQPIFQNYLPVVLPKDADPVTAMYHSFYRTPRGIAIPAGYTLEQTQNRTLASAVKFMNFYPFNDIETISPRPLLFIAGDQAHSREFSEDAYQRAAEPKELHWVRGANHVDLYDRANLIPWAKLSAFFNQHLAA
ncbi:alpha/beta hydrolase [Comamonas piscis]|uniref:Alpha/beta hydrolase n=1 Tax=Comamonas piscis TaxID=1562974 RepID=A0A7G5EH92_9BURK|nr:alpha/beta hydrolase [Comamonas piscis]QMV73367.1 alpha/beta hydrolase [Comamonas piscis]WSO36170.1 alpha/beta hydrolase [Comamonas piscis]